MGRELKRVPLDFSWPVGKTWKGYVNDLPNQAVQCPRCKGTGYSIQGRRLTSRWYGNDPGDPFRPEMNGSTPLTPETPAVRAFAERQIRQSPAYYGRGEDAIQREAKRLSDRWNTQWCHHLNADDVAALVKAGRLHDFTHDWTKESGWQPKPFHVAPTPQQVNEWSLSGFGHDSINASVCVTAACERTGVSATCPRCDGHGEEWPSPEAKAAHEMWEPTEPPKGDGFQIWETVSEGSPISPVFATARELAEHMAKTRWGADQGTSVDAWLKFIEGPGWAPSMIMAGGKLMSGVEAAGT